MSWTTARSAAVRWAGESWAPLVAVGMLLAAASPATAVPWQGNPYRSVAWNTGFVDAGEDFLNRDAMALDISGQFRLRGEAFHNFDIDRGLTPSGQPLYPVPISDPSAQTLWQGDMRFRADWAFYAPGGTVGVKMRLDVIDNLTLGSDAEGVLSASLTQSVPQSAMRIKRVYAQALTPFGVIAAGRMGSHWGLGMLTNGGDCLDCDSGDSADRIAFVTPLVDHIFALAYDFTASGPTTARPRGRPWIDLDPADNVHTVTVAMLHWNSEEAIARRVAADKTSIDYGAYFSYRWQNRDVPTSYLPTAHPVALTGAQSMARGFEAYAVDAWFRVVHPWFRIEAESAVLWGGYDQASLIPGALVRGRVESLQVGAALQMDIGPAEAPVSGGIDAGYASGDAAPGFGAFSGPTSAAPRPGDLDGPQADVPRDRRVDNFRFHPDFRIDRIFFREIVGTVTDCIYLRPHITWRIGTLGAGRVTFHTWAVASFAAQPSSTPGGARGIGFEVDPTLRYETDQGFAAALEYAVFVPLAGLDNPDSSLEARPAQMGRLRLMYWF